MTLAAHILAQRKLFHPELVNFTCFIHHFFLVTRYTFIHESLDSSSAETFCFYTDYTLKCTNDSSSSSGLIIGSDICFTFSTTSPLLFTSGILMQVEALDTLIVSNLNNCIDSFFFYFVFLTFYLFFYFFSSKPSPPFTISNCTPASDDCTIVELTQTDYTTNLYATFCHSVEAPFTAIK